MASSPSRPELAVPDLGGWGRSNLLWLVVSLSMLGFVAAAVGVVVSGTNQPLPPFLKTGGVDPNHGAAAVRPDSEGLRLAGSGSNLPVTRALSAAFPREGARHPVVHASIGSGGGLRALLDGVIDIALVSRPLGEGEREQGLVATPYARVPVVVAVHASVPDDELTAAALVAIYEGAQDAWSDGSRIVVLQRERGDSSHSAVAELLPAFAEANDQAYENSRWRVLYRDESMREALADTRGAIGLFGQGAIPRGLPVRALSIDGIHPSPASVAGERYPYFKDLAFVTRGPPRGEATEFIEFAASAEGRRIIQQAGALPLPAKGDASPVDEATEPTP
ncbi:MAG: substrate-binding domain-containing protein [Deltaproteobacteria bacterium]|nr:substrate-binding domain-containing protein [Deltaproteobacteria bacterium]